MPDVFGSRIPYGVLKLSYKQYKNFIYEGLVKCFAMSWNVWGGGGKKIIVW